MKPEFSTFITALYWVAALVIVIGAISTVIKIKADRWAKEKKKQRRAKDRVDIEERATAIRSQRRRK